MIVCPVCEHAQAEGAECDVCGRRLLHGPGAIPAVAPVEGLEPTMHAAAGDAGLDPVDELEPTRLLSGPDAPPEVAPDVERTAVAPVDVAVEPVPDLEPTAAELPGDAPTAVPAFVTCRYCRNPAMPGERVCGHCGMRLPSFERAPDAAAGVQRICSCGAPLRSAGPCPLCGARSG
jgi:hypothetical protein